MHNAQIAVSDQQSAVSNWQSAVGNRQPESVSGDREGGEGWRGKHGRTEEGRMEGGRKSKGVSQARKRHGFTVSATGVASMEDDRNSLNFFIVEQQKI